ncbi:MAG: hypothetical protein FK730_06450 [Asgard group archaeon]|nr:hypothetical protein [Asgard group archaeon]
MWEDQTISQTTLKDDSFDVYLTSGAFLTLLGSIIENYKKETGGIIIGSTGRRWIGGENRTLIIINSIFPSVTARSKRSVWKPNSKALERLEGFVQSFNLDILGEYHSHPNDTAELSDEDEEYIRDSFEKRLKMAEEKIIDEHNNTLGWIELIVRVTRVTYDKAKKEEAKWWTPSNSNKLRGKIIIGKTGFDVTIGAWAYFSEIDEFQELPVYSEVCSSYES